MSEIDTSTEAVAAPMADLKPCPFCGGEAEIDDFLAGGIGTGHWAVCPGCGSQGEVSETEEEAIAAWDTRATQPEVAALVEASLAVANLLQTSIGTGRMTVQLESAVARLSAALAKWEAAQK